MNWQSIRKVKLHGMEDSRWTTKDKITQYKGLINLYNRDRKIVEFDRNVARRKQVRELKKMRKDIELNRAKLDNAVRGDKQKLRNALAEHRNIQLAYQDLPPIKVLDSLNQNNFNKRKQLDRLNYEKKLQSQKLVDLKLELAELQDRVTYATYDQLPIEKVAQIITGKVQDAILKKEAALAVRNTYTHIRDTMKKDALYFDVLLETFKHDGMIQGKCMIRATELGQLATEYLDDRRQEYKQLSKMVKADMKERERGLQQAKDELESLTVRLRHLIRKDSDVNLAKVYIPKTESEINLTKTVTDMEEMLKYLQDCLMVSNYDCIFPCLEEQLRQKTRLTELCQKNQENRDILLNKLNHAETMKNLLYNKMVETTFDYKQLKAKLMQTIEEMTNRKNIQKELILSRSDTLARVRIGLKQLEEICNNINSPDKKTKIRADRMINSISSDQPVTIPEPEETDSAKIIQNIIPKLQKLVAACSPQKLPTENLEVAMKHYQHYMVNKSRIIPLEKTKIEEELVDDSVLMDVLQIPTRDEIKKQSAAIVEANLKAHEDEA